MNRPGPKAESFLACLVCTVAPIIQDFCTAILSCFAWLTLCVLTFAIYPGINFTGTFVVEPFILFYRISMPFYRCTPVNAPDFSANSGRCSNLTGKFAQYFRLPGDNFLIFFRFQHKAEWYYRRFAVTIRENTLEVIVYGRTTGN